MAKKFINWDNLEYIAESMKEFLVDHNELDNHLNVLQSNIGVLQGKIESLQSNIADLQGKIESLQSNIADLQVEIEHIWNEI